MIATDLVSSDLLIPEVLQRHPSARAVFDRYGLHGCGGPLGPPETIGYFARAHDVDVDRLVAELNVAARAGGTKPEPAPAAATEASSADAIYRPFFLTAIALTLTLGAGWGAYLLARIAFAGSFTALSIFDVNAHGHAQIFGWIGLFVMGFAYQAFPRFVHTSLRWPALAWGSLALMLAGIAGLVAGNLAHDSAAGLGLGLAGGACETAAGLLFATVVLGTRRRSSKSWQPYETWIVAGLVWFVLQSIAETLHFAATAAATSRDGLLAQIATWQAPLRDLQLHGFALAFVLGVSQRMMPAMFGWGATSKRRSYAALALVTAGLVAEAALFPVYRATGARSWLVASWAGSVCVAIGALSVAHSFRLWRAPEFPDRATKFVRSAYAWLAVSLAMVAAMPLYLALRGEGFSHAWFGATRHAITVGFLSAMIVGVSSKVVATLNGVPATRLPALWAPFALLNVGCSLRVAGQVATDFTSIAFPFAGVSGALEVAALAIWGLHVAALMREGKRESARAREAVLADACCAEGAHGAAEKHACGCTHASAAAAPAIAPESIGLETKVGRLADAAPQTLAVFARHGFSLLANPLLRRTIGQTVTIDQACRMHDVDPQRLLADLRSVVQSRT